MACNKLITANIAYDCLDVPVKGLDGSRAVLINMADIDRTATTYADGAVSALVLNAAATGYEIQWFKELGSTASAFTPNAEDVEGFSHSFIARLANTTTANSLRASELATGRFAVVVETAYKGTSQAEAFKVYGLDVGMELSEMTQSSNENSGSILFTLATREGTVERFPFGIYFNGTYAESAWDFSQNFDGTVYVP